MPAITRGSRAPQGGGADGARRVTCSGMRGVFPCSEKPMKSRLIASSRRCRARARRRFSVVSGRLRRETEADLIEAVTYFMLAPLAPASLEHAGEIETSYALALAPQLVRPHRLLPAEMLRPLPASVGATSPPPFHEITRTGNLGDPTRANRECGEHLVQAVLDRLCELVTMLEREDVAADSPPRRKEDENPPVAGQPDHRPAIR